MLVRQFYSLLSLPPHVTAPGRYHDPNGTSNASRSRPQRQQDATSLSNVHSFAQRLDELLLLRHLSCFEATKFNFFPIFPSSNPELPRAAAAEPLRRLSANLAHDFPITSTSIPEIFSLLRQREPRQPSRPIRELFSENSRKNIVTSFNFNASGTPNGSMDLDEN